jgi:hypothetical protein
MTAHTTPRKSRAARIAARDGLPFLSNGRPGSGMGRDRTGETYGPYVAVRPVGSDPMTSLYWVLACPVCGYEPPPKNADGMSSAK